MEFKLKEASPLHPHTAVKGKITKLSGGGGITIAFDGLGCANVEGAAPIVIELYEGKLLLHVWADINQEDPTHTIDLDGAKESARKD